MPNERKGKGAPKEPKEKKPKAVRMSAKEVLRQKNIAEGKGEQPEKKDVEPPVVFDNPAVIDKEEGVEHIEQDNKLEILDNKPPVPLIRKFAVSVTVDQIGLKDKDGNLVDPNNNILKKITFEAEGERVDIAKAAGRLANELNSYYNAVKGKGINRAAGFNVNLHITDEVNGEKSWERLTVVDKLRMNNSIDVAYAVGNSILRQMEGDNADGLLTGEFAISNDGKMFLSKMKFDAARLNMPLEQIYKLLDEKRKVVKRNVANNVKALKEAM